MNRAITGFHRDDEGHWVAELECGHGQHVRHDPPWQVREWVVEESTRREHLGTALNCILCDMESATHPTQSSAYDDARIQGLCHDGAVEAARPRKKRD